MTIESVSLYFKNGGSDKVYHAQIAEVDGGHVVNFQYGRRNSTLATGTKTASPVDPAKAKAIFDKLIKEKMGKGYTTGESGALYQESPLAERFTGIQPQLLNPITGEEAFVLMGDPDWLMQRKEDGERRLILIEEGAATGINRKGLVVSLPLELANRCAALSNGTLLDGELVGERYVAFDLLQSGSRDCRNLPYSTRLALLIEVAASVGIEVVRTATTTGEKRQLASELRAQRAEGVVYKRASAEYSAGRPDSGGDQLKFKFTETASVVVAAVNEGKRSVAMSALAADGSMVHVGNVTVMPHQTVPPVGTVIEVRYLYSYPGGGSLYQPIYLNPRSDIDIADCTVSQFKMKAVAEAA